ncbi:hypothetical protein AAFF_G00260350 [Aldrovandia affinis]|uniref:Uncharacterized protein n=1 Tax=Aldrovandia affinis TaxID=143900 RepID=A0AAD7RCJ4_9TELE|nr:hypothetical protein AAFF_G00260350 [Aldrovandia affinis]
MSLFKEETRATIARLGENVRQHCSSSRTQALPSPCAQPVAEEQRLQQCRKPRKTAILMDSNGKFLNHRELFPRHSVDFPCDLINKINRKITTDCAMLTNVNIAHHPTLTHEHLHDHVHLVRDSVWIFAEDLRGATANGEPSAPHLIRGPPQPHEARRHTPTSEERGEPSLPEPHPVGPGPADPRPVEPRLVEPSQTLMPALPQSAGKSSSDLD